MKGDYFSGESYTGGFSGLNFKNWHKYGHGRELPDLISRPHLAAFLSDPLRAGIRGIRDGMTSATFTVTFAGSNSPPWSDVPDTVRNLALGHDPALTKYDVFVPYFLCLRQLQLHLWPWTADQGDSPLTYKTDGLAEARIRGGVARFRREHEEYREQVELNICLRLELAHFAWTDDVESWEHKIREIAYLAHELDQVVPREEDVDSSVLGYNESDRKLRDWQRHKEEEDAAKLCDVTNADQLSRSARRSDYV